MNDLYYSSSIILFCIIGYFFSWRNYTKDNFTIAVTLLMICGFALRIYTASDFFLHSWDERYHALVAKNLIQHPLLPTLYENPILPYDYRNWTANHIWVHKQPLPLLTMAASMWLFGVNEIALRFPSIMLTTIGIWLSYIIGSYFCNKKVGYLTAFFFSINGLIIELTAGKVPTDHIDIFFLFFIELAIVFSILFVQKQKTGYNLLAGVSIGAAILCKWLPALIVVPIWLLIVVDSRKFKVKEISIHLIVLLLTCVFVFLPWQLYIYSVFFDEATSEASFNFKHITEVLDEQTGSFYYFFNIIRINYGELIYVPLIWFLWMMLKNHNDLKRLAVLVWFLIPFVFFTIVKTKMQAYILFISPALFIMTAEFFFMLNDYKKTHKFKWFFNIVLFLLIALPFRYMIERVKPFEIKIRNPNWAIDLRKLNERNIAKGVLLNYDKPIEAMFYTNFIAYPNIPNKQEIMDMVKNGYTVIVNDNGKLNEDIKTIEGITIEKFNSK